MLLSWYSFILIWLRLPSLVIIGKHDTRQRKYGLNWLYNTWSLVYEKECISASPQGILFFIYYDQVLNNLCVSLGIWLNSMLHILFSNYVFHTFIVLYQPLSRIEFIFHNSYARLHSDMLHVIVFRALNYQVKNY